MSVTFCPSDIILNILENILTAVLDGRSQLKKLEVTGDLDMSVYVDLSSTDLKLLSQALVRLEEFSFRCSSDLITNLFTKIANSSIMKLKRLNLRLMKCSDVPPELFAVALLRMETVVLDNFAGIISEDQISHLFTKINSSELMRLRKLELPFVSISHISPDIISHAVVNLETFIVHHNCNLTAAQLTSIFTKLSAVKDHKLRSLQLKRTDLTSVPTDSLVEGISGLERVDLAWARLTTEQLTGIYRRVADRKCSRLRKIWLVGNDFNDVPQDLRVRAKLNQSVLMID